MSISLNNVSYSYKGKYQTVRAVNGVSYDFEPGKCYAIIEIIRERRGIDALDYILQSNKRNVPEDARERSCILLNKIIS